MTADFGAAGPGSPHQPVLYQEIIHALRPTGEGSYVDCTVGAGGHAFGILEASSPDGRLLGLDRDKEALRRAADRLQGFQDRCWLVHSSYTTLPDQLKKLGWESINGILFDLGMSSIQVDDPGRGFSFRQEGPLDMRFDPGADLKAADLVNNLPADELANLIYEYGEERKSRQIAAAIVRNRPVESTTQLADIIRRATGRRRLKIHPATRTFQALRIAVNSELEALEDTLPQAIQALAPGGRIAVISFHSREDRIVKRTFQREGRDCICPTGQPSCTCGHVASLRPVTRKPLSPKDEEVRNNPRARSAKL
ncbi:MAG: 16S rRNA (cytosine(1402)-N(4))-methyltransferase RsmH, partial [Anaerolineales bacterium]|nr:16S rRNA (cytosine(1402)-N(4))-methyltransferase RsmH [Anaerolineales bacterium]